MQRVLGVLLLAGLLGCGSAPPPRRTVTKTETVKRVEILERTERYVVAFSQRSASSSEGEAAYVDLMANRTLVSRSDNSPLQVTDDKIRIALDMGEGEPVWQPYTLQVSIETDRVNASGSSAEQRAYVEHFWSTLRVFVPELTLPEQTRVGAAWRTQHTHRVRHLGVTLPIRVDLTYRTVARSQLSGQPVSTVLVQGEITSDRMPLHGRDVIADGTVEGTRILGPRAGESSGAFHLEIRLRDAKRRKELFTRSQDIGYAVAQADSITPTVLTARAAFDADYTLSCTDDAVPERLKHEGSLEQVDIRPVIDEHIEEVRRCYQQALVGWPTLAGTITPRFIVERNGSVKKVAIAADQLGHPGLACCIINAIKGWEFPSPTDDGRAIIAYPFALSPPRERARR